MRSAGGCVPPQSTEHQLRILLIQGSIYCGGQLPLQTLQLAPKNIQRLQPKKVCKKYVLGMIILPLRLHQNQSQKIAYVSWGACPQTPLDNTLYRFPSKLNWKPGENPTGGCVSLSLTGKEAETYVAQVLGSYVCYIKNKSWCVVSYRYQSHRLKVTFPWQCPYS